MPSTIIKGSSNISVLNSAIKADLCAGQFVINVTPSAFVGSGASNTHGVRIKIENPYHIAVKEYDVNFDIAPPLTDSYSFNIPTQGGGYQVGEYLITAQLEDADGIKYEVTKPVVVCEPNPKNKFVKYGELGANLSALCIEAKLRVSVSNPPTYKGLISNSQTRSFLLQYPTASNLPPKEITVTSFSTYLFDGVYKMKGEVCATYLSTDNISYKVKYILSVEKNIRCSIDECCIFTKLTELHQRLANDCTEDQRNETSSITVDVLRLLETAKLAAACGEDPSEYVNDLEDLLQCRCSVLATDGVPLFNNTPTKDFVVVGCNVDKNVTGLTTTYTIENYEYVVDIPENGGALIVSASQDEGCTKKQIITFDISNVYGQVKDFAQSSLIEANAWGSIINKVISGLNVTSLGITPQAWLAMNFAQRVQAIINKIGRCCDCGATVTSSSTAIYGDDVIVTFNITAYSVDIYLDNNFVDNIIMPQTNYTLVGAADGSLHNYTLVPKCSNGVSGTSSGGSFVHLGCPYIQPPSLTSYNVQNATCPFDLDDLYVTRPDNLEIEYHAQNNTSPDTLMQPQDAAQVSTGVYYAFHKNASGCYSAGVKITINCVSAQCTAPVNVGVAAVAGGFLVFFDSAINPPSANAYIVKRRLRDDADIPANYTMIGSTGISGIQWNPTQNRWEILDTTGQDNTLYTYIAISDCGATQPYTAIDFSNYSSCPVITGLAVTMGS